MQELTVRAGGRVLTQNTTTSPKGFTVWFTRNHSPSTGRKKTKTTQIITTMMDCPFLGA